MNYITNLTGRTVTINGKEHINLSTTGYLNLSVHPYFQTYWKKGVNLFGLSYGSSPLSNPRLAIFSELENTLAAYYNAESALLFSTGFAAVQSVIAYFVQNGFEVEYGSIVHPALCVPHNSSQQSIFASDMVDVVDCELIDEESLKTNKINVIDASHGFGILDAKVRQYAEQNIIVCGSLNKAFATTAGVVLCSKEIRKELELMPMYSTSSAPAPAACYALYLSLIKNVIANQQERLSTLLQQISQSKSYKFNPQIPVLLLKENGKRLYEYFYKEGFIIWHNEYPKGSGKLLNRAVIHAGLYQKDIERFLCLLT